MNWLGHRAEDSTINIYLTTNNGSGGAVAPSSAFEVDDFKIYKDGGTTQKATTNGLSISSPFDAIIGLHLLQIDTSVDTGDAGFWAADSTYMVLLDPDETVDSQSVVAVLAEFAIGMQPVNVSEINSSSVAAARLALGAGASVPGTVSNAITTPTTTVFAADDITEATANHYVGRIVIFTGGALQDQATTITGYSLVSGEGRFVVDALTEAPANDDTFLIL